MQGNLTRAVAQDWIDAFPLESVPSLIAYVQEAWEGFIAGLEERVQQMSSAHEPQITKAFCVALRDVDRRKRAGIGGQFMAEVIEFTGFDKKNNKAKEGGRSDIRYNYPACGDGSLIIEFKKLYLGAAHHEQYCSQGMMRFLDRRYAPNQTIGSMCGIVETQDCLVDEAVGIMNRINAQADSLMMNSDDICSVPSVVGNILAFDSKHQRPPKAASPSEFLLVHFFLSF